MSASDTTFSHVRKVALDLEVTGRFYSEIFGFKLEWEQSTDGDSIFLPLTEITPPVQSRIRMYRKGEVRLELSAYTEPGPIVAGERLPMNAVAMTHISFRVGNLDDTLAAVRRLGGRVLEHTRVHYPATGDYIMCLDPDGLRVELMPTTPMPRVQKAC